MLRKPATKQWCLSNVGQMHCRWFWKQHVASKLTPGTKLCASQPTSSSLRATFRIQYTPLLTKCSPSLLTLMWYQLQAISHLAHVPYSPSTQVRKMESGFQSCTVRCAPRTRNFCGSCYGCMGWPSKAVRKLLRALHQVCPIVQLRSDVNAALEHAEALALIAT